MGSKETHHVFYVLVHHQCPFPIIKQLYNVEQCLEYVQHLVSLRIYNLSLFEFCIGSQTHKAGKSAHTGTSQLCLQQECKHLQEPGSVSLASLFKVIASPGTSHLTKLITIKSRLGGFSRCLRNLKHRETGCFSMFFCLCFPS